jgi:hypothetical protein
MERTEQSLIAVINDVRFDFSFEPSDISTLRIDFTAAAGWLAFRKRREI